MTGMSEEPRTTGAAKLYCLANFAGCPAFVEGKTVGLGPKYWVETIPEPALTISLVCVTGVTVPEANMYWRILKVGGLLSMGAQVVKKTLLV